MRTSVPATSASNTDLVVLAVLLAGGAERYVDVEDIAVQCYRLSPKQFGWRLYEYPSAEIARIAVKDVARRPGAPLLIRPKNQSTQRMLTAEGIQHAIEVATRLKGRGFAGVEQVKRAFASVITPRAPGENAKAFLPASGKRPAESELRAIRRHLVFAEWKERNSLAAIEDWEIADVLTCLPDSPPWVWTERVQGLRTMAARWQDREVAEFLDAVAQAVESRTNRRVDRSAR